MIDQMHAYDDAPSDSKPECRPWMIQTLSGLVPQTTDALRNFSPLFKIIVLHGDSGITPSSAVSVLSKIPNNSEVWDPANKINMRTIIITSVNTANSQYGPTGFYTWKKLQDPHWKPPAEGFAPLEQAWPNNPQGRVRGMVLDEVQYGFRNNTAFAQTVKWFKAPSVWLFSGSPSPRGLEDWAQYISLIELDELAEKAPLGDDSCGYTPNTNPYKLPDDNPAAKYRFTSFAFQKYIIRNREMSDVEKGIMAQSVLRHFVLRRDYESACPLGSDRTIARNLPPLRHYSVELLYCPTDQQLYNDFYKQWGRRLILQADETGNEDPMPNPRAVRAVTLITTIPLLGYLHRSNPEYNPLPKKGEPGYVPYAERKTRKKTAKNDQDWESWFNDQSTYWKSMPKIGNHYRRWRWILDQVKQQGCKAIPDLDYTNKKEVTNKQVLEVILAHSPKLQALLSNIAEHSILRDEKMLVWFLYPVMQELVLEILLNHAYLKNHTESLHSGVQQKDRTKMQNDINDPAS